MPSWSVSEQQAIVKMLTTIINGQKAYGKDYSISDVFDYFKLKLEGKFYAKPVMAALDQYTDRNNDIPTPADIIEILNPPERKITQSEYIAALEYQKNNGYPNFSYEKYLIDDYVRQNNGVKTDQPVIASELKERLALK